MVEALFAHPESSVMFTLGIVALVLVSIFKEDFFRPSTLYFLVQMVMLGVSYLQFLPMMSDFNYSTWLVWGGGMFCFLVCAKKARISASRAQCLMVLRSKAHLNTSRESAERKM